MNPELVPTAIAYDMISLRMQEGSCKTSLQTAVANLASKRGCPETEAQKVAAPGPVMPRNLCPNCQDMAAKQRRLRGTSAQTPYRIRFSDPPAVGSEFLMPELFGDLISEAVLRWKSCRIHVGKQLMFISGRIRLLCSSRMNPSSRSS